MLFLASQFPYPADSGTTIKTLSVLEYLRRRHDLRLVAFNRGPLTEDEAGWATEFGGVQTVSLNRGRNAWNAARSYLARVPLSIERNRSGKMSKLVEDTVREFDPQAIFVDGWLMAQYVPKGYTGLKLLHEHNAEYLLWERQAAMETGRARRWLVKREAARVRSYERSALHGFDAVFAVSEEDRRALRSLGVDPSRLYVLPNIPDRALLDLPRPTFEETEPLILYLGTLSWQPNIEGVRRFVTSVLPAVLKRVPEARLIVAGKGASKELQAIVNAATGADFEGEVEDPEPLYKRARVFVDATRSGGGTRLKVLNAMARGIPVVSSPQAAHGLDIVPGEHLVVARNDAGMADAVALLLRDATRWKVLSQNGRALVLSRYLAENAYRVLDDVLARTPVHA